MKRDIELETTLVAKYAAVEPVLDERSRWRWAAAESLAIGYGGDAVVSSATGVARETIRKGRREIARDEAPTDRIRRPDGGRPRIQQDQPGIHAALQALVDPLTRGDPTSPLRWTCKSRAKLAAAQTEQGWRVSSTTVGRLLHRLGYRLQSPRKRQGGGWPSRPPPASGAGRLPGAVGAPAASSSVRDRGRACHAARRSPAAGRRSRKLAPLARTRILRRAPPSQPLRRRRQRPALPPARRSLAHPRRRGGRRQRPACHPLLSRNRRTCAPVTNPSFARKRAV